jgi:hypothetical protein
MMAALAAAKLSRSAIAAAKPLPGPLPAMPEVVRIPTITN